MAGNDLDMIGLLSGMFGGQGQQGGTIGSPMQILPQVQQDGMTPGFLNQLKTGIAKNSGDLLKFSGGLLNQPRQALPMMQLPARQPIVFGGAPSAGARLNPLLSRFR